APTAVLRYRARLPAAVSQPMPPGPTLNQGIRAAKDFASARRWAWLVRVRVGLDQIGEEVTPYEHGPYAAALVQTMRAVAIRITPGPGHAVDRDSDRLEVDPVGGTGRHGGYERHARKVFGDQLLRRSDDLQGLRERELATPNASRWRSL